MILEIIMEQNSEFQGISSLRFGMLFLMLTPILEIIGFAVFSFYNPYYSPFGGLSGLASLELAIGGGLSWLAFIIIIPASTVPIPVSKTPAEATFIALLTFAFALGIVGLLKINSGFNILNRLGKEVGTPMFAFILYLIYFIMVIIGGPLMLDSDTALGGVIVLIIASIFGLIATVFLAILFYKVGEAYDETITKMRSILSAIPNANVLGNIIIFMGLGKIKNKLAPPITYQPTYAPMYQQPQSTTQPLFQQPYQQPQQAPQITQTGQGVIGSNGYAKITLNSPVQADIVSAKISGTNITSISVNPPKLQPGQNDVIINFGNVSSLTPGMQYTVILTINLQGRLMDITTYVTYPR